jgi:3-(3-hydroxy-phenyl)propionate hydroxylase
MPATPAYDGPPVAVIGAGPVGQTAALLLARWGIPAVLLERHPERTPIGSRSICQQRDVLDVWAAVGAERITDEGVTWTTARTFYREGELFAWSFVDRGRSPLPPFVNISQSRTEQILDESIAEQPLVDVRWGHEVTDVVEDDSGITVACTTAAGETTLRASYVVAAVGGRGDRLRKRLGVAFHGRSLDDRFLICDIRADLPGWETERRFYFDPAWNPDRQVLIHPCPDSTYRIDWQVPADFDLEAEEASGALDARIRKIVGDRPYEVVWQSVYQFQTRHVDRMRVGRVLLAGDCAHLVAPFGARGLNSGVPDAENAAWKLAFVLHGWAPEALLDSYHDERMAAARENIEITSATMRFLVPQSEGEWQTRRDVLDAAVTDPQAQARVDLGRFAEPFWYVDSPLTTADPTRTLGGRPAKGEMPPTVPGVLAPDAPVSITQRPDVSRLRQLVRDGLLLLTTEGVDPGVIADTVDECTAAPHSVLRLADIDVDGAVETALAARPREAWLIRPDGHVAAVLTDPTPSEVCTAVRRMIGADVAVAGTGRKHGG